MRTTILMLTLLIALSARGQQTEQGDLVIHSSLVCEMCKERVEKALAYSKGVKQVRANLPENSIHVKYNPRKTSPDEIRHTLLNLGYTADGLKPTREAYDNLHMCCKADGIFDE